MQGSTTTPYGDAADFLKRLAKDYDRDGGLPSSYCDKLTEIADRLQSAGVPCDMGEMCLDCQPRGLNGECPDAPQSATLPTEVVDVLRQCASYMDAMVSRFVTHKEYKEAAAALDAVIAKYVGSSDSAPASETLPTEPERFEATDEFKQLCSFYDVPIDVAALVRAQEERIEHMRQQLPQPRGPESDPQNYRRG